MAKIEEVMTSLREKQCASGENEDSFCRVLDKFTCSAMKFMAMQTEFRRIKADGFKFMIAELRS